jgi:hypothetical protein
MFKWVLLMFNTCMELAAVLDKSTMTGGIQLFGFSHSSFVTKQKNGR